MKDVKLIRGQVRQIVQEVLEDILKKETIDAIRKDLTADITLRLRHIENNVKETLTAVDQRSKDSLAYLIRQSSQPSSVQPMPNIQASGEPTDDQTKQSETVSNESQPTTEDTAT